MSGVIQDLQGMLRIVSSIYSRDDAQGFRSPVDWEQLGLTDYPVIVKKPMDLGTVKKRLESGFYKKADDAANDVRLIWTNCMMYNTDGSEYYHLADRFATAFEGAYAALRKLEDSSSDSGRVPTIDEKMNLSYDIFKIDNKEMAKVLTMIEYECPEAMSRKNATDNDILVNFDALTPSCFHEVNKFVQSCVIGSVAGKKKADKPAPSEKGLGSGRVGRPPGSKSKN